MAKDTIEIPFTAFEKLIKSFGEELLFNSQEELNFYNYFNNKPFVQRWLHPQFPMREYHKKKYGCI